MVPGLFFFSVRYGTWSVLFLGEIRYLVRAEDAEVMRVFDERIITASCKKTPTCVVSNASA